MHDDRHVARDPLEHVARNPVILHEVLADDLEPPHPGRVVEEVLEVAVPEPQAEAEVRHAEPGVRG